MALERATGLEASPSNTPRVTKSPQATLPWGSATVPKGKTVSYLSMKQLLEAGVHFGHETKRWNPKMKRFIFAERNGIFIIDLQKTLKQLDRSFDFVKELAGKGGVILFVGTKKQAQEITELEARRSGMPFINQRWLGGLMTNFTTIRGRIKRMTELEAMFEDGTIMARPKAERILLQAEMERLNRYLGGIRNMTRLPDALFIIDPTKEAIAVKEAQKLGIPVVALADTDSDPDVIDYIVPGNDDAIRSIQLITSRLGDLVVESRGGGEDVSNQVVAEAEVMAEAEVVQA
jgi:small subunit ribosomal protein S2